VAHHLAEELAGRLQLAIDVVEQKIHALNAHVSQGLGADDPHSEFLKFVRERWRGEDGRYTERFRRVVLFR